VKPNERERLLRGYLLVENRWVKQTPEQLRAGGYIEHDGRWLRGAELDTPQREWKNAWLRQTPHWRLQTDHSESFANQLAVALEQAYDAFAKHFAARPKGTAPLRALAFKRFEDYRAYCQRIGAAGQLMAAGFSPSEPRTCCGWDQSKDRNELLRTMIHEACHLYFDEAHGDVPSWVAEGMATYFEGFDADGTGRLKFHHRPSGRLRMLRSTIGTRDQLLLADLTQLEAGQLIQQDARKAASFYATCFGYYAFFREASPELAQRYASYIERLARGARPRLEEALGLPVERIDAEYLRWIKRQ
jgi:hypothetical protein